MTGTNFFDSESSHKGSLYPELDLKKMTLSMVSSSTSTSTVLEYVSSGSTEEVGERELLAEAVGGPDILERQRAPYSVPPEGVLYLEFYS